MGKLCPIGLICADYECRPSVCEGYAQPWPIPLVWWHPDKHWIVEIPQFDNEDYSSDFQLQLQEQWNARVEYQRSEYFQHGWWEAVPLPYCAHPDGGLVVTYELVLDGSIGFYSSIGMGLLPGFYPAVSIENGFSPGTCPYSTDQYGFCNAFLRWNTAGSNEIF